MIEENATINNKLGRFESPKHKCNDWSSIALQIPLVYTVVMINYHVAHIPYSFDLLSDRVKIGHFIPAVISTWAHFLPRVMIKIYRR